MADPTWLVECAANAIDNRRPLTNELINHDKQGSRKDPR